MVIIKSTALCTSLFPGIGIGIIIGVIGYFTWIYLSNKSQEEALKKSQENIQKFFEEIETISKDKFNNKNLFIISIKKNKQNINDICLLPWFIEDLNSQNCPSIGAHETADSNSDYYSTLIDGIEFYLGIYAPKIHNYLNNINQENFINELEKDISFLKSASKKEIRMKIYNSDPINLPEVPKEYNISENENNSYSTNSQIQNPYHLISN